MEDGSQPLVSVIIPTFNRRSMVSEAVESAISQDLGRTEVIVVDDGSTDGTAELVRTRFREVRLVSVAKRSGRSAARNLGIETASAPYVAFLDSDDRFGPWHLRQLTWNIDPTNWRSNEVRYGTASYWDPQSGRVVAHQPPRYLPTEDRLACLVGTFISLPTMLVPRCRALEVGGFPDSLEGSEDWVFLVRLSRTCRFVPVGGRPSVQIRVHGDRSMADVAWDLRWRETALDLLRSELVLTEEEGRFLVAGHHRYRAARLYELGDMPAARAELRRASRWLTPIEAIRWNGRLMAQSYLGEPSREFLKRLRRKAGR